MSRKSCKRRRVEAMPPRGLRPKLQRGQLTDLAIAHLQNLDLIAKGQADGLVMQHLVEQTLTWSRVADLLGYRVEDMRAQMEMSTRVVERFGRTGRVGFSGVEYQVAKLGIEVMDDLAERVDQPTASQAADWSEQQMARMWARAANVRANLETTE
jgi:hypothetical protein